MDTTDCSSIQYFFQRLKNNQELHSISSKFSSINAFSDKDSLDEIIDLYRQALAVIEPTLWKPGLDETLLAHYQGVFRELENLIEQSGKDDRFDFIIVIPVADRPQHLSQCLDSLLELCRLYRYGGFNGHCYRKLSVIVADDSAKQECSASIEAICADFSRQGINTEYFGAEQQLAQLQNTDDIDGASLERILGDQIRLQDPGNFSHKGAAITRNFSYLRANQVIQQNPERNYLVYFIDSDQEFRVKVSTGNTSTSPYAINYFHHLNEIFTHTGAEILTGKVVGDPPVSPAVMAANFQRDIIDFLQQARSKNPLHACEFHDDIEHTADDARYHDMANLFGFKHNRESFKYHCLIDGEHNNAACFTDFADRLGRFFDGEHPTRNTYFRYEGSLSKTTPARTVYTGNYVLRPSALRYFIAFATLKLRMAGPALGRLIKSEVNGAFVSANLPMLHKRTISDSGQSECRPGVKHEADKVDLSGEFERQFYGDIMLFTIDRLTRRGYPEQALSEHEINDLLQQTVIEMQQQYESKHELINERLELLKSNYLDESSWWHNDTHLDSARDNIINFIKNVEINFSDTSTSYNIINSIANREKRLGQIMHAIMNYTTDQNNWPALLK